MLMDWVRERGDQGLSDLSYWVDGGKHLTENGKTEEGTRLGRKIKSVILYS